MHQVTKGNQWYFVMKAHVGVDAGTKLIHSVARPKLGFVKVRCWGLAKILSDCSHLRAVNLCAARTFLLG